MNEPEYAGFWIRTGAAIIDSILMLMVIVPALTAIYGIDYWTDYWTDQSAVKGVWDMVFNYILPAIAVIVFWSYKSATPGKMATKLVIVDARTGGPPSTGQLVGRYLGYYLSILPLFLGIIWVGIDKRKQGWHDKLAGTVVIRKSKTEPVKSDGK